MDTSTSTVVETPTSRQIEAQLAAARERIATLDDKARDLSLPAVAGDQQAVTSLASIRVQIQQAEADLAVLADARMSALRHEASATEDEAQAYRERHFQTARERAAVIVQLAGRADELVAEFKTLVADMRGVEREIWIALREAGQPADSAIVGRKNLDEFPVNQLRMFVNGTDRFRDAKPVVEIAKRAWSHLLTDEARDD